MNIYLPKPTNQKPGTVGEHIFFDNTHWKLAVILGYSWKDDVCTRSGFSFFNIRSVNGKYCERIINFLEENEIKYSTEFSEAGWQYRIKISKAKKYIDKINELYKKYYTKKRKECKGMYIYDNWYLDEETFLKYKSYHKNDPDWTLEKY